MATVFLLAYRAGRTCSGLRFLGKGSEGRCSTRNALEAFADGYPLPYS